MNTTSFATNAATAAATAIPPAAKFVNMGDTVIVGMAGVLFLDGDTSRLPKKIQHELRDSMIENLEGKKLDSANACFPSGRCWTKDDQDELDRLLAEKAKVTP